MGVGNGMAMKCFERGWTSCSLSFMWRANIEGWGGRGGHSVLVTWIPPEAPVLFCMELQGVVPVAVREPHNLAGEAGSWCCNGMRPPTSVEEVATPILLGVISRRPQEWPPAGLASLPRGRRRWLRGWGQLALDFPTCRGQCPESLHIYHPRT